MKKKLLILLSILMTTPLGVGAVVKVGSHEINDGECYQNICYDESTNTVTMDGATVIPTIALEGKLNLVYKGDTVWDANSISDKDNATIPITEYSSLNILIKENSTFTLKNQIGGMEFEAEEVVLKGEKNSKIIFDDSDAKVNLYSTKLTIDNIIMESTNSVYYLIHSYGEGYPLTIKNSTINVDRQGRFISPSESIGIYEYSLIGSRSAINIINSTINSKNYKGNTSDPNNACIGSYNDIKITNSNITSEEYIFGINTFKNIDIKGSNLTFNNCKEGLYSARLTYDNSTSKFLNTTETPFNPEEVTEENTGIGIVSTESIVINNGYLEFRNGIIPMIVIYDEEEKTGSLTIKENMVGSKEYTVSKMMIDGYDAMSLIGLIKKGSPDVVVISEEDMKDLYTYSVTDLIIKGKTKVHFDAGDGKGQMADVTLDYLTNELPENKLTPPEGKRFKGWSTSKGGEIITSLGNYEDVTLYPIWEDIPKEEKKEKENPNTGMVLSITSVIGMLALGGYIFYTSNKKSKFN